MWLSFLYLSLFQSFSLFVILFRKYRSESDFRAIGGIPTTLRPESRAQGVPLSALRQANSRASIAVGTHINSHPNHNHHSHNNHTHFHNHHQYIPNGKHYGHRSHSEADLLAAHGGMDIYDYGGGGNGMTGTGPGGGGGGGDSRIYTTTTLRRDRAHGDHHLNGGISGGGGGMGGGHGNMATYGMVHRKQSNINSLVYPNIQVHCLDVNPCLRGVSLQAKAGDLFAIMATSQREGTALTACLAGLQERIAGEILINGQQINGRGLRELCSYVPSLNSSSLDPRMSVQCTLNFHAALRGPLDRSDLKERVSSSQHKTLN